MMDILEETRTDQFDLLMSPLGLQTRSEGSYLVISGPILAFFEDLF